METSTYGYNVRGWLTRITGIRFNQTLAYNTAVNGIAPAKELYNGNISAMKWKARDETTERGYKFAYDGLDRLTGATYGEGSAINTNPDRFNETLTNNDKMGNIETLVRRGKLNSGYGEIDNLTYTYTGNRLTKVSDAVTTPITHENAFHFVDGANVENEYTYDANGNLTRDLNKNIDSVSYNVLNLPEVITFVNGNTITYDYDGSGSKLSVAYYINSNGITTRMDYAGNKVYNNGTLGMILTGEGYITSGTTPTYHYYLKDHQGNNRVVINQAGTVLQVNHYYPFGGLFGEGVQDRNQRYKYNDKELDRLFGLDTYDYGARHYDAATGRWWEPDPLTEQYYSVSPYVYVGNSPIIMIDPDGKRQWPVNETYNGYTRSHRNNYGELRKNNRAHRGLDINLGSGSQDLGAPVYATHDGSVTRIATIDSGDANAGGNRVQVTSDGGEVSTYYMHLNSITEGLEVGSNIVEGTQIGTLGGSGDGISTRYTPHLHYELNIDGQRVSPVVSTTQLIDPQTRLTPVPLPEVTVTGQSPAARLPQINVPEPCIPDIRLSEQRR